MNSLFTKMTTFSSTPIVKGFVGQKFEEISRGSEKFTDPLFPPKDQSLYSYKKDHENYEMPDVPKFLEETSKNKFLSQFALTKKDKSYIWQRLSEVYNIKDLNVIKGESLSKDVLQGELGDCYFLSALAALAENPSRIRQLISQTNMSPKGVYETLVYLHGEPTKIVVDDYFPFLDFPGMEPQVAFAGINPESKNIWPMLLEKAWAKCNLSYEDIAAGNSAEAFEFLTPAPFDTYYHNADTKLLFGLIQDAIEKKYIVVSDITDTANSCLDYLSKMGLVTNHAYSIIDTAVLLDKHGKEIRLIKVRNPWGTNEWLGDWSDQSNKWTDQFKEAVGLEQKEDGIFWICYEDFIQFYTSTHICHIHDDYKFISKKFPVGTEDAFNLVNINIPKDTSGYFMINMKNTRIYSYLKGIDKFENPYCQMTVFRKTGKEYAYIGSNSGKEDRLYVYCDEMIKGNYYIAITFPKKHQDFTVPETFESREFEKMTYRVGVYSTMDKLNLTLVTEKERVEVSDFIEELIEQAANTCPNIHRFSQENENDTWRAISFEQNTHSYGYIYYKNNSDAYLKEKLTFLELENVNIIPILRKGQMFQKDAIEEEEEIDFEDQNTQKIVDILHKKIKLESSVQLLKSNKKEVNAILVDVAPKSSCIIILQKSDDDASIDIASDICFDYLSSSLLTEQKFKPKKYRLKYNNKPTEIFECVTEHNTGILFQYKNKTSDLKAAITVSFSELDNLYLAIVSDDLKKDGENVIRESVPGQFRGDNNSKEVSLTVEPGETKFFGLRAIDSFKKFSYNSSIDYHFSLSKGKYFEEIDAQNSQLAVEEEEDN